MSGIFDYDTFEIKLKPLLSKLNIIRQEFGEPLYEILVKMLEFDEDIRISFEELLAEIERFSKLQEPHATRVRPASKSPIRRRSSAVKN